MNKSLRLSCVTNSSTVSSLLQASSVKRDTPGLYSFSSFTTCGAVLKSYGLLYALCFSHHFFNLKPNRCFVILYGLIYIQSFLQNNRPYFLKRYKKWLNLTIKMLAGSLSVAIEGAWKQILSGNCKKVDCQPRTEPISVALQRKGLFYYFL